MTCDCISYNRPQPHQKTPSVVVRVPERFVGENETVCIDACIVDQVRELWAAGIWTHSCCCGHNGDVPRHVVVDKADALGARDILRAKFERPLVVQFWVLACA